MPKHRFPKGNDFAKGGARPGAGRTPDWFREQCRKALEESRGIEFMQGVANGDEFPQLANNEGEVLPLPPSLKDREHAVEWLADRGFGKPSQPIEHSGDAVSRFVLIFPEGQPNE